MVTMNGTTNRARLDQLPCKFFFFGFVLDSSAGTVGVAGRGQGWGKVFFLIEIFEVFAFVRIF